MFNKTLILFDVNQFNFVNWFHAKGKFPMKILFLVCSNLNSFVAQHSEFKIDIWLFIFEVNLNDEMK